MIWILILHMQLGVPARVIIVDGPVACLVRSSHEMRWDPLIKRTTCMPWSGGEA